MKRIIYHDEDPDGWMSAAIILSKYPDSETYQIRKSRDELELKKGYDEVYVVDSSLYDEKNLLFMKEHNKRLIWIDHHKSVIETYAKEYEGLRDTSTSACTLAWKYMYPNKEIPPAVMHISDYDTWTFKEPNTKKFIAYLQSLEFGKEIENMSVLLQKNDLSKEYELGETLLKFQNNLLEQMYATGVKTDFCGHKAMIFHGEVLRSELGNLAITRNPDIDISVVVRLSQIKNGRKIFKYSLRSRKSGFDVSELAKQYNGGGHQAAAAFHSEKVL